MYRHRLADTLKRIDGSLHALSGFSHGVASPLGVWLLDVVARALAGEVSEEESRAALGMPLGDAVELAGGLLAAVPTAVRTGAVVWVRDQLLEGLEPDAVDELPRGVALTPMPSQAEAAEWVDRESLGLLSTFPADLSDPDLWLVLANVLACRVRWQVPFELSDGEKLGGAFGERVGTALTTVPGFGSHRTWFAESRVGVVVVHTACADGLQVWSVIADPSVAPGDVLSVAHEMLALSPGQRLPVAGLPVGEGHSWTMEDVVDIVPDWEAERGRVADVALPAWSARSEHDLSRLPTLGSLVERVMERVGLPGADLSVGQVACASYRREGFDAAALTMAAAGGGPTEPRERLLRQAHVRFGHPHAVLAVADSPYLDLGVAPEGAPGQSWQGLVVFSAWVAEVEEAD